MKKKFLTFTAQPDSSKLERKAWERNGLNFPGPVASRVHASQSSDETSVIEDTTESNTISGCTSLAEIFWKWDNQAIQVIERDKSINQMNNELLVKAQRQLKENTNTSGPETVKANSPREITILFVSETFFGPQNSALVLDEGACTQFGVASLICDFSYSKKNQIPIGS